jgi:hypothetical protein
VLVKRIVKSGGVVRGGKSMRGADGMICWPKEVSFTFKGICGSFWNWFFFQRQIV